MSRMWAALGALTLLSCATSGGRDPYESRRLELVDALAAQGITDSTTLAAMRAVPRHEFVPPELREWAYANAPLPIGHDQTISQPYIVATMTQAIQPRPGLKVLEIGTGSGYQAAVLAQAGCRVFSIEIVAELAAAASATLARLGVDTVSVRHGDGYAGWPEAAPFDAILVTAAPEQVPDTLLQQLAPGGRLVAPIGGQHAGQDLLLFEKSADGKVHRRELLPVRFVPMRRGVRGGE
jgi:protein-L-isoaspartate(D-aspartate) O-methyltransferase